VTAAPYSSP